MTNEGAGASAPLQPPVRIAVLIPSRGRPNGLLATILSMHGKLSGQNDVTYVIGCDAGDDDTISMALSLWQGGLPVVPRIGERPESLGGLVNQLAEKCPADVYCSLGDDVRVLTMGWDGVVAKAWRAEPDGVWWWCASNDATFAIVSEAWRQAAGRIFSDHFPYWWDDLGLIEIQRYVLGRKGDRLDIHLQDRAAGTHRMRDLAFWERFFWSLRGERQAEARMIAERLGRPAVSLDGLSLEKNADFNADEIEAKDGDRSPPTPEYLSILNRAKALMAA